MIALTSTSSCDICLEGFGQDPAKVPCSLQCGHVFCYVCLPNVPGHLCPLCRIPFTSFVKLHLDVDGAPRGSPKTPPSNATQPEQEARRLLSLFDKAIDRGCSEGELMGLLEECKAFLGSQPRSMFSELRTIKRLMGYLHKVKGNLVAQTQSYNLVQSQVDQLRIDKQDLEQRLKEIRSTRKVEKKAAHNAEKILRDHCSRAHTAYESVVEQYNFVVQEWMRLQNEVRRMQIPPTPQPELATPDPDLEPDLAKTPQPRFTAELDQTKLKEAVVQDPSSLLISPLPQFTGQLPDALPLPDDDEAQEVHCAVDKTMINSARQDRPCALFHSFEVPYTPSLGCDAPSGHPLTCNCEEVSFFPNGKHGTPRPAITSAVPTPVLSAKVKTPPQTPGLSATPLSPGRNRSHTIPTPTSRPPSRAASPKPRSSGSVRGVCSPASGQSSLRSREPESLKSRLHDLLQDDTSISTSLPNMSSSHFPSSLTRETPQQTPRPELSRPSSDPGNTPPQHRVNSIFSPKQGDNECVRVSPPTVTSYMVPATPSTHSTLTPTPAPVISRASNAAMAMEKERKEKKEQERERRRTEKRLAESESLGRSNSISSTASASAVSSTSHPRIHAHSGREPASYTPQRLTSASTSHKPVPIPIPSPGIFT